MSTVLFEFSNWLVAVLGSLGVSLALWRVWSHNRPAVLWLLWLISILVLLALYALKASEIALGGSPFKYQWGLGRRWGDVSHWFIVLFVCVAWIPAFAASILNLRLAAPLRLGFIIGVAMGHLIYLLLVRAGDRGQTFFYPASWLSGLKWIQVVEGFLVLWIIGFAQLFVCVFVVSLIEIVERWKSDIQSLVLAIPVYLGSMFTIGSLVLVKLPATLRPTIKWLVSDAMPGYDAEFRGPKPDLLLYQVVGLVLVPFLTAAFIAWLHLTRSTASLRSSNT